MSFHFAHPQYFGLLIFIPIILGAYFVAKHSNRTRQGITHVNSSILNKIPARTIHKNNYSLCFALLAVAALIFALAGPFGVSSRSSRRATVVLVIDTSISMESTDVKPSRIQAAKIAAKQFVDQLDPAINVGLISFNSGATVESTPTSDHEFVKAKIAGIQLNTYTATGQGISSALQMIAEFNEQFGGDSPPQGEVILESDGKETVPVSPDMPGGEFVIAKQAKQMNIPVHTISFGTPDGTVTLDGVVHRVPVDDESLAEVAKLSGGKAFTARNMDQLKLVYDSLSKDVSFRQDQVEQPFFALIFAAIGIILTIVFSSLWGLRKKDLVSPSSFSPDKLYGGDITMNAQFEHSGYLGLFLLVFLLGIFIALGFAIRSQLLAKYAVKSKWKSLGIKTFEWKRILPVFLALISLCLIIISIASPINKTKVPRDKSVVILVLDISRSMAATDVAPSRLDAAKKAIAQFVNSALPALNIGLVTFDASAAGVVNPTKNHQAITNALSVVHLGDGTATGSGINEARRMVAKFDEEVQGGNGSANAQIILLSDGKQTAPSTDIQGEGGSVLAARSAKEDNIKIFPIAIGTKEGTIKLDGEQIAVPVDLSTLRAIAAITGGEVATAENAQQALNAYQSLGNVIGFETKNFSHPFPWILSAFIFLLVAIFASIFLNHRVL